MRISVIGGGAASFFYAINRAINHPEDEIHIYEQSKDVLNKVRISGGGRCNVTHACFEPKELSAYYPRGRRELLGPFHKFACGDMIEWLDRHGVDIKIEEDGRIFPSSDDSQTIIDCFLSLCRQYQITIHTRSKVQQIAKVKFQWLIKVNDEDHLADAVFIGAGSSSYVWQMLKKVGHTIINPVPSLFTFNTKHHIFRELSGISQSEVQVSIPALQLSQYGPLLITHWGISGPAVLKLSAIAARELYEINYRFDVEVDWLPTIEPEDIRIWKEKYGAKFIKTKPPISMASRLWINLVSYVNLHDKRWADITSQEMSNLITILKKCPIPIHGKSTFKEEFVTAGGVDLKEINFSNFSSKLHPTMYLAGEILNIDAVTGGFNFQSAWTGAYLAAIDPMI